MECPCRNVDEFEILIPKHSANNLQARNYLNLNFKHKTIKHGAKKGSNEGEYRPVHSC